jgi:hypothetical protein
MQSLVPYLQAAYYQYKLNYKEKFENVNKYTLLLYGIKLLEKNKRKYLMKNVKIIEAMSIKL